MWIQWTRPRAVFAPENEAGQGGEGGDPGGGEGAGGEGAGGSGDGGEGESQGGKSSILDFASGASGDSNASGDEWKLPEGLEIPEHLRGTSAEDTLAKLSKAYAGARREISERKPGQAGEAPKEASAYVIEADGEEDKIAAELNSEESKPVLDAWREAALKAGMPAAMFQTFLREGMGRMAEQGLAPLPAEEEARINGEAEMEALTKEVGPREAGTIVNTITQYGQKLQAAKVLQDEADVAEFSQMVGTARAARIFHRMLVAQFSEKPIPAGDGVDGSVTPQEAYAAHAAALRMPRGPERDLAISEAEKKIQKAVGDAVPQAGSVRSSVL